MRVGWMITAMVLQASPCLAIEAKDVIGTWRLVSSTRKIVETGEVLNTYGEHPSGWITYGKEGRMMTLIVNNDRPKPASIAKMTDAERIQLFKTVLSYSGTYSIAGITVTHKVDTSSNEVWTGTSVVRNVTVEGDRLIYVTNPAPFSADGRVSITTLTWEKVH